MKIVGTSGILKDIRQSGDLDVNNSLIFQYPFMIDKSLEKKWGNLLRDFFVSQFISQIKINNVLKTIVTAIPNNVAINSNGINPAEKLQRSLGNLNDPSEPRQQLADIERIKYTGQQDAYQSQIYQHQIDEFRKLIYNQIKIDPIYRNKRPIFSNISLSNNIQIPLILGTHSYTMPSSTLYWMLFLSIGQKLSLDNPSNFNKITQLLREIPEDNYMDYLFNVKDIVQTQEPIGSRVGSLNSYLRNVQDQLDKNLRKFSVFLDEKRWNQEVGIGSSFENDPLSDTSIKSSAWDLTGGSRVSLIRRSSSLFSGFVANDVIPLLRSSFNAIISNVEVDVVDKLDIFNDKTVKPIIEYYDDIMNYLKDGLIGLTNDPHSLDTSEDLINIAKSMCRDNANINVKQIFDKLSNLHFTILDQGRDLAKFMEGLEIESSKLSAHSKILESNLTRISLGNSKFQQLFNDQKEAFGFALQDLFLGKNRSFDFKDIFSTRFQKLTGTKGNEKAFLEIIFSSVSEILHFLSLYCFFSYMCEYLHEVQASIHVQKRDATDFPNYVLVIPIQMLKGIYFALSARNFKAALEEDGGLIDTRTFNVAENQINRIIGALNTRLRIPNIIVVDDKANKVYYKWMYFKNNNFVTQLDAKTMQNYVQHQHDALRVF